MMFELKPVTKHIIWGGERLSRDYGMGENGEKLLLFDDFSCYDDGCYIGKVSKEVIAKMPKEN